MKERKILNGKKITFHNFNYHPYILCNENGNYRKDEIKRYIFNYINIHILEIKACAKISKSKLTIQNTRMCMWVCFQRGKIILYDYKINLNIEDENNYLDEYFRLRKLNLKSKKFLFDY